MNNQDKFDRLYEELLIDEEKLKNTLTGFATGDNMKLSDADKQFKSIKDKLKQIRQLAKQIRG